MLCTAEEGTTAGTEARTDLRDVDLKTARMKVDMVERTKPLWRRAAMDGEIISVDLDLVDLSISSGEAVAGTYRETCITLLRLRKILFKNSR
jgi:hypothetical protein